MIVLESLPFSFTKDFLRMYESLNPNERSEILFILDAINTHKLNEREMLVSTDNANFVTKLDDNDWIISSKKYKRRFEIRVNLEDYQEFSFKSLKIID